MLNRQNLYSLKKEVLRLSKLPFKFIYLIICLFFFLIGLIYVSIPIKRRPSKKLDKNSVVSLCHVAISFDGRVKKSINQLIEMGFNVTLVKPGDSIEDRRYILSGLNSKAHLKSCGLGGVFSYFPYSFDVCMFLYALFCRSYYLHCHDIETAFMGLIISKIMGKKLTWDMHDWKSESTNPFNKNSKSWLRTKLCSLLENKVIDQADYMITVNEFMANAIKNTYKTTRKIFIVRNLPIFQKLEAYDLRKRIGADKNNLILYYVGQVASYRNIDNILIALSQSSKDVLFVLQGPMDPSYLNHLKSLAHEMGVSDQFFILPPIPHDFIPSACQGADIGVFTLHAIAKSMIYTLPNKLFEYIAGELPIIADDIPPVRPYILTNNIGTLINSKDPLTISQAIESYKKNKEKLAKQKNNVLKLKESLRQNTEMLNIYEEIYKKH